MKDDDVKSLNETLAKGKMEGQIREGIAKDSVNANINMPRGALPTKAPTPPPPAPTNEKK